MSRDPEVKIFQNINGEQRNLLITSFINVWVYLYVKLGAIPRKVSEGIQYTERNTSKNRIWIYPSLSGIALYSLVYFYIYSTLHFVSMLK